MKKLLLLTILFVLYKISYGQCDKAIIFKCDKARELINGFAGQGGSVEASISIEDGKIILSGTMNGESETMEGKIEEITICEWSDFLNNGKMQYKALMKREDQSSENTIIDIESKNGYTTITFGSYPDTGSKLQFDVSEFTIAAGESVTTYSDKPDQKRKNNKEKRKLKPIRK